MNSMFNNYINDNELLYRSVPKNPDLWETKFNRPSSGFFLNPEGISVDRDGGRAEQQIIKDFDKRYPGRGLVSMLAKTCREIGTKPVAKPLKDNIYHAEIHDEDGSIIITSRSKRRKLAIACKVVKYPFSE